MCDDRHLDEKIARLVRSIEERVPPPLERRIRAAAEAGRPTTGLFARRWRGSWVFSRRRVRILALVPGAAAMAMLAVFWLVPALRKPPAPRISEIRTEFEIADKNIKIIFFQKPDFQLTREE